MLLPTRLEDGTTAGLESWYTRSWCRFLCVGIAFGPITYRASLKGKKAGGLADGIDVWFLGSEVYENVMDLGKKNN